ncbi:MAG: DUF4410 domain-containing protein [Proteobacteria bacterium]|nr:DUF4410 domain-containing protein [Pseudomonadota bacterium]
MKRLILIGLIICLAVVVGCHSRTNVPKAGKEAQKEATKEEKKAQKEDKRVEKESLPAAVPAGKNLKISVLMDTGDDNLAQIKMDQRERLNDFMGTDLVRMLNKAGYEASLIESRSQYKSGTYLLKVTIVRYSAGSKAARIVVGFGAGAVSLDTRYELFAPGGNSILSDEHGVGSSLDWTSCARKLNKQTVDAVKDKLGR